MPDKMTDARLAEIEAHQQRRNELITDRQKWWEIWTCNDKSRNEAVEPLRHISAEMHELEKTLRAEHEDALAELRRVSAERDALREGLEKIYNIATGANWGFDHDAYVIGGDIAKIADAALVNGADDDHA